MPSSATSSNPRRTPTPAGGFVATVGRLTQDAKRATGRTLRRLGVNPSALTQGSGFDDAETRVIRAVERYTMTSPERIAAVCKATRYVAENEIGGAIVECGVWRGGSSMAAALTLLEAGIRDRDLYLFDTYEGMTDPTDADRDARGRSAARMKRRLGVDAKGSAWCYASLEDVRSNLGSTGYPRERVHYVKGPVEETIPATLPGPIALLRLDTDWYESTRHELEHLMPLLRPGGVLIIDDYGHWQGARRAVDEYLERTRMPLLLNRIDYTGRIAVMPGLQANGR
jgi:O-methyltransferase